MAVILIHFICRSVLCSKQSESEHIILYDDGDVMMMMMMVMMTLIRMRMMMIIPEIIRMYIT